MTKYITVPAPEHIKAYYDLFIGENNAFVAGGALRKLFETAVQEIRAENKKKKTSALDLVKKLEDVSSLIEVKDIDLFFPSEKEFNDALMNFKNSSDTEIHYESDNSVGLSISWDTPILDLVRKNFGTVEEVLNSFDFTVSQCALYRENDDYFLIFSEDFWKDIFHSRLRFSEGIVSREVKAHHPLERTARYIDYGFTANKSTIQEVYRLAMEIYPEFDEIRDNEKMLQKMLYSDFSLHKNFSKMVAASEYKSKSLEGSFTSGYALERELIRFIVQRISAPEFNGEKFLNKYGKKYGAYELPYGQKNIGLTTFKLLKFLESKESVIGKENLIILTHFLFSYNFAINDPFLYLHCNVCSENFANCSYGKLLMSKSRDELLEGHSFSYITDDFWVLDNSEKEIKKQPVSLSRFSENSIEVVYKAFMLNGDSDQWVQDTAQFFLDYASFADGVKMSLKRWHEFIDDGMFDPSLPPSLMLNLVS